jgi:Pyruvate/2-oxoacid:ferredoxin oxidoreductase gamma subunit
MKYDIAFAGIGGQGILFIGTLLAAAAINVLKDTRMMNMIMLGASINIRGIVKEESIIETLHEMLSPGRKELIPLNKKAFELGLNLISDGSGGGQTFTK